MSWLGRTVRSLGLESPAAAESELQTIWLGTERLEPGAYSHLNTVEHSLNHKLLEEDTLTHTQETGSH